MRRTRSDGSDSQESVLEDGSLLSSGVAQREEDGHDSIRKRSNLLAELSDDGLRREGKRRLDVSHRTETKEKGEEDATHGDDGAKVSLQVVPVVSVVGSNELVL